MPRPHNVSQRVLRLLTCTYAVALAFLFVAPAALSQEAGQQTAADNGNPFSRWFRAPVSTPAPAIAAPAIVQPVQSIRKPRVAKIRKRSKPVAAQRLRLRLRKDSLLPGFQSRSRHRIGRVPKQISARP